MALPFPLIAFLCACVFAIGSVLVGEAVVGRIEEKSRSEALTQAEVGARVVQQLVFRRVEAIDGLHRLAQSWFALRAPDLAPAREAIERELRSTAEAGSFGIIQVAMIDRAGWMTWSTVATPAQPLFLGDREHFQVHERGRTAMFVSRPVLGRVSNRWTLQVTRPLREEAGAFGGVVVLSIDLLSLAEGMAEAHLGQGDRALLVRDDGSIAVDSRAGLPSDTTWLQPEGPLLVALRRGVDGAILREISGQRDSFIGWHRLPGTPLVAVYQMDAAEALEGFERTRVVVRIATAGGALLAMAIWLLLLLVTERRRVERERERQAAERGFADAAHAGFARRIAALPAVVYGGRLDPSGGFQLTHMSDSLERVTGWSPAAVSAGGGTDWASLMEPAAAQARPGFLASVLAEGHGTAEYRLRRPEGQWLWVRDHLRVLDGTAREAAELVGYIADITAEREMGARAQAAGRLATLGEMATGLAHELNQPLAVMSLAADNAGRALARRGAEAVDEVRARLARIAHQAQRARSIVDHLRVFGRQDDGALESVSLATALEGALLLTGNLLREHGIEVKIALPEALPPVQARLVPLEQALVNLLLNARDAIEEAGIRPGAISVSAEVNEAWVSITVADNGGGIPEAALARLFEPFFTTKAPGKGTGLGLPICYAAMRGFGGRIAARNEGAGAAFTLDFLPWAAPSLAIAS